MNAVRGRGRFASSERFGAGIVVASMFIAAVLACPGLDNHAFWDDEANTAVYARNLLERGELTAWDGTNLLGYAYGGGLGEDLGRELRVPGLPACVAALGMWLFGLTTFGGRILFVAAGVLSVGLLAVWLRRHFPRRFPWWLPSLILALSPAYLLYIRNCRYYALAVLFTLLVWTFWAPGQSRGRMPRGRMPGGRLPDVRSVLRYAGASAAMVLLLWTHYLSAAAVLVTLPLFFLDRRYRQPRQYVLLAILYAVTAAYGGWVLVTANPFAAEYVDVEDWLVASEATSDATSEVLPEAPAEVPPGFWSRTCRHLWWLLRDLGTHEFFPWCLVAVLGIPWLPADWLPPGARSLRPLARGGLILVGLTLGYVLLAAFLTPLDMGKGPTAEMRYVVPLIALGAVVGGVALALLWRLAWPLAPAAFLLLAATNLLHLGFLTERYDRTCSWWPPTLYRYVAESFNDHRTGNEEMLDMLAALPPGTTIRTWPTYRTHPAIFYVPRLHYCDQLTEKKPIRADLRRELPDYVFVERAEPEVVLVPAPFAGRALDRLRERFGPGSYRLKKTLSGNYNYISKPEIPDHCFLPPQGDWHTFQGIAVLVAENSPVTGHEALAVKSDDPQALYQLGTTLKAVGDLEAATRRLTDVVRITPNHFGAHFQLGILLAAQGDLDRAIRHYETVLDLQPRHVETHVNLGLVQERSGEPEEAMRHYRTALEIRPDWPSAHYNLANLLASQGATEEAVHHFRQTLKFDPDHVRAHINLGVVLAAQNRIEEAIAHYRAALEINPDSSVARVNLGSALVAHGDRQGAITEFRKALRLAPSKSPQAEWIRKTLRDLGAGP